MELDLGLLGLFLWNLTMMDGAPRADFAKGYLHDFTKVKYWQSYLLLIRLEDIHTHRAAGTRPHWLLLEGHEEAGGYTLVTLCP